FRIWDINQKTFYLRNNQLIAGYLQGPNTKLEGEWVTERLVECGPRVTLLLRL
ncbi:Interleukin-1 receptor antagonist protein, partial [Lemmus lemmus]